MEEKVLSVFLYNNKLKFSDIEKLIKVRSNKLAYYLKKLTQKRVIVKEGDFYKLSENSEFLIPYLTDKKSVLPVLLIAIGDKKKSYLCKREKRPYKCKLGLPGGRLLLGEDIPMATERIMKEKFGVKCKFKKINSVSLEHLKKKDKIIHSFLLIFVQATTKEDIKLTNVLKNKNDIIESDFKLIKNDFDKETKINLIDSKI